MKFKIELEVEILDEEVLELINIDREWNNEDLYNSIEEIPKEEIKEWIKSNEDYFRTEVIDYDPDINKITMIEEDEE